MPITLQESEMLARKNLANIIKKLGKGKTLTANEQAVIDEAKEREDAKEHPEITTNLLQTGQCSPAVFAVVVNVTARRIQQLLSGGVLIRGKHNRMPFLENVWRWMDHQKTHGTTGRSAKLMSARERLAMIAADTAERESLLSQRKLCDTQTVVDAWANVLRTFEAHLRAMPNKVAGVLMVARDKNQIAARLDEELRDALKHLKSLDAKSYFEEAMDPGQPPGGVA